MQKMREYINLSVEKDHRAGKRECEILFIPEIKR